MQNACVFFLSIRSCSLGDKAPQVQPVGDLQASRGTWDIPRPTPFFRLVPQLFAP